MISHVHNEVCVGVQCGVAVHADFIIAVRRKPFDFCLPSCRFRANRERFAALGAKNRIFARVYFVEPFEFKTHIIRRKAAHIRIAQFPEPRGRQIRTVLNTIAASHIHSH